MTDTDAGFKAWCAELDKLAESAGYESNLTATTGDDAWLDYYEDGYTPAEALNEDASHAE